MSSKSLNHAAVSLAVLWLGAYGCGGDDSGGDTSGRGGAGGASGHAGAGRGGASAGQGGKSGSAGGVNSKGGTGGSRAGAGGTAGDHSIAGESGNAGQSSSEGGSSTQGGRGGASGHGGKGGSENTAGAGAGGESTGGTTGNAGAGAGGEGGAGPAPQMVTALGCFATTGDGFDYLDSGAPAIALTVATGTYCGGLLVSDNPDGFAPEFPPTTLHFTREFVIDDALLAAATFSLSYRPDDQAEVILNGQSVASCTPSTPDSGECTTGCQSATISTDVLRGGGRVNRLEIILTNTDSVDAGGGHFGYTDVAYSLCASE